MAGNPKPKKGSDFIGSQFENLLKLGLSPDEANQVLADDAKIEKGEKLFELTADQEKASKKARQVSKTPTVYNFQKLERKADDTKRIIIQKLVETLAPDCDETPVIVNPEREIIFMWNEKKYKITLSAPRK